MNIMGYCWASQAEVGFCLAKPSEVRTPKGLSSLMQVRQSDVRLATVTKMMRIAQFTIPYGHFVTHHYFVIFNYRPQIYTTHLATSLNTFNIFPYPIPSETKQFHKEMIEIVFSM
jgi:hypothetical protein